MIAHDEITNAALWHLLRQGMVQYSGNRKLHIYGTMRCTSGKRMKRSNRVFFNSEAEAVQAGYRPCAHCMKQAYNKWKNESF